MKLNKIKIENFKSIDKIEFEIKKYGNSYTIMFVGINEVGKTNILEAISYLTVPPQHVEFKNFNNRNHQNSEYIDLYFEMNFEDKNNYLNILKEKFDLSEVFIKNFKISNIIKNVYLKKGENTFNYNYDFEFKNFKVNDYYFNIPPSNIPPSNISPSNISPPIKNEIKHKSESFDENLFTQLDEKNLQNLLYPILIEIVKKYELQVTFWKPEKEFLITHPINLNTFKNNSLENLPLKNIFALSNYKEQTEIKSAIDDISTDYSLRRSLQSELTTNATKYFGNVWEHKIEIDIEITENLQLTVSIKDKGVPNKDKYFNMESRSQGFQQFVSLILSLSIQNYSLDMKNNLILIDEPENHLHPSGIRNMMSELLRIGKKNYVFLATHSCFMIDKKNKERNFIIKKDNKQNTIFNQINDELSIFDDEVLSDAFGINIYKDFLTPHKLLVEGSSDKQILQKTIKKLKNPFEIGITNGYGSNIDLVASRLALENIKILVLLDADESGIKNKSKIIKIGDIYSSANVLTIKDLEPKIVSNGTIEDALGLNFIQSKFNEFWETEFDEKISDFTLVDKKPFIKQIKIQLHKKKSDEDIDKFIKKFKIKISEEFNPADLDSNFPLLKSLVKEIIQTLKEDY